MENQSETNFVWTWELVELFLCEIDPEFDVDLIREEHFEEDGQTYTPLEMLHAYGRYLGDIREDAGMKR